MPTITDDKDDEECDDEDDEDDGESEVANNNAPIVLEQQTKDGIIDDVIDVDADDNIEAMRMIGENSRGY